MQRFLVDMITKQTKIFKRYKLHDFMLLRLTYQKMRLLSFEAIILAIFSHFKK